jgi:nitrate reductase gamma subunit/ferredoxin
LSKTTLTVDPSFTKDIISFGGEGIKKCYQCGTCTSVCPVSEDTTVSFRKMIKYIQVGLPQKALQMPGMWMCVNCRDCVAECPRDANPSNILAALRRYATSKYSNYKITKKLTLSPSIFGVFLLVPIILLAAVIGLTGAIEADITTNGFVNFIHPIYVDIGGIGIGILVGIGILYNLLKARSFIKQSPDQENKGGMVGSFFKTLYSEVLIQKWLYKCTSEKLRWIAHLAVFWGFVAAAVTTTIVFITHGFGAGEPLELTSPTKILGNISGVLLIFGGTVLLARRLIRRDIETSYFDWLFIILLYVVSVTGVITEVTRLINSVPLAQVIYFIHLSTTATLLSLAPFTKFAHSVYRPVVMFMGRMKGMVKT